MSDRRYVRLSDPQLIGSCLSGEAGAWDAMVERYEAFVYSVLLRAGVSRSDADDLFQDVFLLLYSHLSSLRDHDRLAGWLASTAKREVWRLHRRRAATAGQMPEQEWEVERAQPVGTDAAALPDESVLALEDARLVRQGLEQLGERCRTLLTLLYMEEPPLAYTEVSERLEMPIGSIGPTRARCLQQLQKILGGMGF